MRRAGCPICYSPPPGTDAKWQDMAKGVAPAQVFGAGRIHHHWTLAGPEDLVQTVGAQIASAFTLTGVIRKGRPLKPANVAGLGLRCESRGDG